MVCTVRGGPRFHRRRCGTTPDRNRPRARVRPPRATVPMEAVVRRRHPLAAAVRAARRAVPDSAAPWSELRNAQRLADHQGARKDEHQDQRMQGPRTDFPGAPGQPARPACPHGARGGGNDANSTRAGRTAVWARSGGAGLSPSPVASDCLQPGSFDPPSVPVDPTRKSRLPRSTRSRRAHSAIQLEIAEDRHGLRHLYSRAGCPVCEGSTRSHIDSSQRGCCALSGGAHGIPRPRLCLPVASFHAATRAPNNDPWPQLAVGRLLCGAVLDQPEMAEHVTYLAGAGGEVLFCVEPNGAAGPVGFFDCLGFFFSLLLRS